MHKYFTWLYPSTPMILLFCGGVILTAGDLVLKKWVVNGHMALYALGMLIYLIGLNFLAFSFKSKSIAVASVLFIVFNVITLAIAGRIFFNEPLSLTKIAGIITALISVAIIEIG